MIDEKKLIEDLNTLSANNLSESRLLDKVFDIVESQPKVSEWISVSERLPDEHDSMFAKFKGTDKWNNAMFEKTSDDVNATVEFEDGTRIVKTLRTIDGAWRLKMLSRCKVIAWQPLPKPYKEVKENE